MRSLSLLIAIVGLVALTFLVARVGENNTPPGAEEHQCQRHDRRPNAGPGGADQGC